MPTKLKKRLLLNSQIYLILDKEACSHGRVTTVCCKAIKAGVSLVQLREKSSSDKVFLDDAVKIKKLCQQQRKLLIINNRLDVAQIVKADGIHLGQTDLPLVEARKILGKNKIIGISCHNLVQAQTAQAQGADYIGIGPIFATLTKPGIRPLNTNIFRAISKKIKIPFFAIGGVTSSTIGELVSCGIKRVAICSAICQAKNIPNAIARLQQELNNNQNDTN